MTPAKTTEQRTVDGACLCGAVTFTVALPPKWVAHCHCSMCRRAHGAGFVTWAGFDKAAFTLKKSDTLKTWRSSPEATREFCGQCGSPLFFRGDRWEGEVHVARAAIAGDVEMAPKAHVFFSDKVEWTHVGDGLPRRGGASGVEPLPSAD